MYVSFDDTVINNGSDFVVKESEKSIEKLEEEKEKGRETNCVYFTVTDRNIIKNLDKKVVEVRFGIPTHMTEDDYNGIVDPNEKQQYFLFEEEDGTKVCLKEFFPKVTTVDGKKVLAKGTGITYKAKIPADVLGDRKNVTVYAVARTKITQKFPTFNEKGEKVEKTVQKETDPCKATFRIQRMGLMDLD